MKTKTLALFIMIMSIAILPGCKKDQLADKAHQEPENPSLDLKTWFESETKSATIKDIRIGTPLWQRTKYYAESETYITPIKLGAKNPEENKAVCKFLVAKADPKNGVTRGNYIYLIPDKKSTVDISAIDQNLLPAFFSLEQIPTGFTATIIKYDLNYKPVFTKSVERGKMTDAKKKIVTGQPGAYRDIDDIGPNSAVPCGQCVDYYLITYDAYGNIISVEYLYTLCGECEGEEGGGGGNPPSTCNMTQNQAENAINAIVAISTNNGHGVIGSPSQPDQNGIIRAPKPCIGGGFTLNILPGYSPHWDATYAGIVYKLNPTDAWKWESISYSGFPQTAGEFPPCVSANTTAWGVSAVITADKLKAITAGNSSCHVSWTCLGTTRVKSFSGQFSATFLAGNPEPF